MMMTHLLRLWLLLNLLGLIACLPDANDNAPGALFITSEPPDAEVVINGKMRGRTPLTVRDLEPRDHDVIIRKDTYQPIGVVVTIRPRQTINVAQILQPDRRPTDHRLAFISNRDGAYEIWLKDQRSAQGVRWTNERWPRSPIAMDISPDGAYFAVSAQQANDSLTTWLVRAPQVNVVVKPEAAAIRGDLLRYIEWAPDARAVLLKSLVSQTIWQASLNGVVNQIAIPDAPRGVTSAAYTPDGNAIVYSAHDKTWQINLDGTRRKELAFNGAVGNAFLRYSPDGQKIVHVRAQRPNIYSAGELWLMNADGSLPDRLSLIGTHDFDPIWTKDGKRIVFVHRENVEDLQADEDLRRLISNLWVIDLTTRSVRTLTAFQGKRVWEPSLSPDNELVTFISNATGFDEVWSVDFRGGDPQRITNDKATASFPLWLW
jgi:Tol biopolymer transport system component